VKEKKGEKGEKTRRQKKRREEKKKKEKRKRKKKKEEKRRREEIVGCPKILRRLPNSKRVIWYLKFRIWSRHIAPGKCGFFLVQPQTSLPE
jgi:hypothetical protein